MINSIRANQQLITLWFTHLVMTTWMWILRRHQLRTAALIHFNSNPRQVWNQSWHDAELTKAAFHNHHKAAWIYPNDPNTSRDCMTRVIKPNWVGFFTSQPVLQDSLFPQSGSASSGSKSANLSLLCFATKTLWGKSDPCGATRTTGTTGTTGASI